MNQDCQFLADKRGPRIGLIGIIVSIVIGVGGYFFVADRFEYTDARVQSYEINDDERFDQISSQLDRIESAISALNDVEEAESPALERREFISGVAATSDPERLIAQNSYRYFDAVDGTELTWNYQMLIPVMSASSGCIWANTALDSMSTQPCDAVRAAATTGSREEFPVYVGWWLEYTGSTPWNGRDLDSWHLCFTPSANPEDFSDFADSSSCLSVVGSGMVDGGLVSLLPYGEGTAANVVIDPIGNGLATVNAYGSDGFGVCLVPQPDGTVIGDPTCGADAAVGLDLVQFLIYASVG